MGKPLRRSQHLDRDRSQRRGVGLSQRSAAPGRLSVVPASEASDARTIEKLFDDDPRATPAAEWIAHQAAAALEDPTVLDPVIDLLLEKVVSEPLASVDTKRRAGDFSVRPAKTARLHNLADYETFEDVFDLPTGALEEGEGGPAVEYFSTFAARKIRAIIVDILKTRARRGLIEAPGPIRAYLTELAQREALDDFAATVLRDLSIAEHLDEYHLVETLAALSFGESLLERGPDQAARLATDAVKADRHRPERRAKRKLPQAVDTIFRGLRHQPAGAELTAVSLLGAIVDCALGVDGLDDDDRFGMLRLVGLLARDERILALLPKRGAKQLQRDAAHWIGQAERGALDVTHPLVFLYKRLDQSARAGAAPTTVVVHQGGATSTFRPSNWPFFLAYALGPGDPDLEDTFEIVLTRVEAGTETDGSRPLEIAAGILIEGRCVSYLTADEFRQRHGADLAARTKNATLRLVGAASLVFHDPDE